MKKILIVALLGISGCASTNNFLQALGSVCRDQPTNPACPQPHPAAATTHCSVNQAGFGNNYDVTCQPQ